MEHSPPSLSKLRAATPFWWPSFNMDTVSMLFVSHTQMNGFFPVCPVATIGFVFFKLGCLRDLLDQ
jgi:hypothetical protein